MTKCMVMSLWNLWTHTSVCLFLDNIREPVLQKICRFVSTERVFDVVRAFCPFLGLRMVTYKDDVPYFIWMRPGMKPSIWWLSKHFQCTSHNEHWDRYADQRLPLYHGICEKKEWSQIGPDNTGEECGEQMITCQVELPSHCSQFSSFGFWLFAMWAAFQLG